MVGLGGEFFYIIYLAVVGLGGKFFYIIYLAVVGPGVLQAASFLAAHRRLSCGSWIPERESSVVVVCGLSCSTALGILVPRPGIKPTSPALQSGFLTTGPPEKLLLCEF